jgi:hypothetical protein
MKINSQLNYKLSLNVFLGLVLLFYSCKKDPKTVSANIIPITNSDCIEIPPFQGTGWGYNYITNGAPIYTSPVLNPNNNNELLILKNDSVFIFNRTLNNKSFSFKFSFWNKISWSKKNWLIMGGADQKIYKIKPNGDSLTLLVNTLNNFNPIWNDSGTQFCVQNNTINKVVKYDNQGNPLDTIQQLTNQPFSDWGTNNKITWGLYTLNAYDVNTKTNANFYTLPSGKGVFLGFFWLNNNEIIWSYSYGIYKTNISTSSTALLKQTCNSAIYSYPTYDKIANKIIWRKQEETLLDAYNIKTISKIVITDIDCNNEAEIIIN